MAFGFRQQSVMNDDAGYATQLQCSNEVNRHCVIAKPTWSSYIPLAQAGLLRKNRGYATQPQCSNEANGDSVIAKLTWSDYIFGKDRGKNEGSESAAEVSSTNESVASLKAMGVHVFGLDEPLVGTANEEISWDNLAGYDHQKREIEDTLLLPLGSPKVYDEIACGTRHKFESNRPRAVLFEGPPGTGKTASARVIANQADKKVVVIGATNRKQDLDRALISRFDSIIFFGLPDQQSRKKIAAMYAKHLTVSDGVCLGH